MIPFEWLRERLDSSDVEDLLRRDLQRMGVDRSDWHPLLEGAAGARSRQRWADFIAKMKPGDELWRYESSGESRGDFADTAGYAIVREGKPVETLTSWRS